MLVHILISIQIILVHTYLHRKPVAKAIWDVPCKQNEHILNDCNWCHCGAGQRFQCKARICEQVDMFGHFKDTIQEFEVGMEGHGSWRSRPTSCTPGVQYQRGTILCICDEDGNWPNPVCRDLLRILHAVEVIQKPDDSTSQSCSPTKLYLVGCNACLCPSSGKFDANLCTNRTCYDGDPVLEFKDDKELKNQMERIDDDDDEHTDDDKPSDRTYADSIIGAAKDLEVYAPCVVQKMYMIGDQKCECLSNNRLICKKHEKYEVTTPGTIENGIVRSKKRACRWAGQVIKRRCNLCRCADDGYLLCTLRGCYTSNKRDSRSIKRVPKVKLVKAPIDDIDCIPGTYYRRGCNTCFCKIVNDVKMFGCTVRICYPEDEISNMVKDCVYKTSYEIGCLLCDCVKIDGEKHQVCKFSPRCSLKVLSNETESLDTLRGFCEPEKVYRHECNTCTCLSDGRIAKCTNKKCASRSVDPVDVEIFPIQQAVDEICPTGYSYKVDCNLCVCLPNGNALCTTADCTKDSDY